MSEPTPVRRTPVPTTSDAVAASVACARAVGLPADGATVVYEGYSVRVHLRPAPVITRVVTEGRILRGEPREWMRREVAVAGFLAGRGAAVVAPWDLPGPFTYAGLDVSLWHRVEHRDEVVPAVEFGPLLHDLHTHLDHVDPADALPPLIGPLTDIATARRLSGDPVLHRAAEVLVPLALSWPRRALHGDAHTGNLLMGNEGPLWTDFEDVCSGPVEWDLASFTLTEEAVAGYPGPIDPERHERCRDLRALQILAAILADDPDGPDSSLDPETQALRERLVARLLPLT